LIGVILGLVTGFVPGLNSNNLSLVLIAYGFISSNYYLAVTAIAIEISFSFFEFLSPMLFRIGNDVTSLAINDSDFTEESFKRGINIVVTGGLLGILISLPLLFFADNIYPAVYSALKPFVGWILLFLCVYMVLIERNLKRKISATAIFCLSGLVGLLTKNSGLIASDYLLVPIFIGLYGFSSILRKKYKSVETIQDIPWKEKIRISFIAFVSSMFASLVPSMKRGQASTLALQLGKIFKREEVLFILPLISLAFVTLSLFVLNSTGSIRSTLAYDINEIMGDVYISQTILFAGTVAVSACLSICILILIAKPIGKLFSRINEKYIKIFGFCVCMLLIINFTGFYGILLAFTTTAIGLLSSRLGVRSTHMMGVLLLPSIVSMIL